MCWWHFLRTRFCFVLNFSALSIPCHSLLACEIWAKMSTDSFIWVPLYVTSYFSPATFKSFNFYIAMLIIMCPGVDLFGVILFGNLCFLDQYVCFLLQVRDVFSHYFYNLFFLSLSPWLNQLSMQAGMHSILIFFSNIGKITVVFHRNTIWINESILQEA